MFSYSYLTRLWCQKNCVILTQFDSTKAVCLASVFDVLVTIIRSKLSWYSLFGWAPKNFYVSFCHCPSSNNTRDIFNTLYSSEEEWPRKQSKEPPPACRSGPSLPGRRHGWRTLGYGHGIVCWQNGTWLRCLLQDELLPRYFLLSLKTSLRSARRARRQLDPCQARSLLA